MVGFPDCNRLQNYCHCMPQRKSSWLYITNFSVCPLRGLSLFPVCFLSEIRDKSGRMSLKSETIQRESETIQREIREPPKK